MMVTGVPGGYHRGLAPAEGPVIHETGSGQV
jgi:hypothetical protein